MNNTIGELTHVIRRWTYLGVGLVCALAAAQAPFALAGVGAPVEDGAPGPGRLQVSSVTYAVPDVQLQRDDGEQVSLRKEMDDGRPVVLNFVFTSCRAVCPLMSQVFGQFQRRLGSENKNVHLMSISIDPEQDTPERLRAYAEKFRAGPGWQHYTGTLVASVAAQRAFGVYRGDKMSHAAVTLMRAAPGQPWRRIDGFVNPEQLLDQYHALMGAGTASR